MNTPRFNFESENGFGQIVEDEKGPFMLYDYHEETVENLKADISYYRTEMCRWKAICLKEAGF